MTHNPDTSETLCFVAGRSGGHLVPALTLATRHKKLYAHAQVIFITTDTLLDTTIVHKHPAIDHAYHMHLDNLPGKALHHYPRFFWDLIRTFCNSLRILRLHKPKKIICTGGYIALPVCLAATLLRIPIELYELNAVPGRAIKTLAPLATSIACCFERTKNFFPAHKVHTAPYPIRFHNQAKSSESLPPGFSPQRKTILIVGGSQGSVFINTFIKQWIETSALKQHIQIIHQTGAQHGADLNTLYARYAIPAVTFGYTDRIEHYYHLSDLVICRSGAGSLFETLFFKKPCLTIPLETVVNDHQVYNAYACAQEHPTLVTVMRQKELENNPAIFERYITYFISS